MEQKLNRTNIRQYFGGKSQTLPILLAIVGIFAIAIPFVAIILWIIAAVLFIKNRYFSDFTYEEDVDKAMAYEKEMCKTRALEKLGLIKEQVAIIEPIFTSGPASYIPATATSDIVFRNMGKGLLGKALGKKEMKKALKENSDDPLDFEKVGSDDQLRYTLLCNTALYFGEEQIYIYYENVDIATGLVYQSGTREYFYKDIEAISTTQTNTKQFVPKKKKYIRVIRENFTISLAGTYYTGAFGAVTENGDNKNVVDNQFAAMRNLVRDKKNEK